MFLSARWGEAILIISLATLALFLSSCAGFGFAMLVYYGPNDVLFFGCLGYVVCAFAVLWLAIEKLQNEA